AAEPQMQPRAGCAAVTDPRGVLRQGRAFLDFFWDIAKPEQEVRLAATENLLRHLREGRKVSWGPEGGGRGRAVGHTAHHSEGAGQCGRGTGRARSSTGTAYLVLQAFEEIPLCSVLEQIKEKHNLEKVKKKLVRNAAFGNFFGVMALFQSGRLVKDQKALLESIQLLHQLTNHQTHLRDLPRKTLIDITSEVPEALFEEVLFDILQGDLSSAFTSPENLHLLLVGMQKFPSVLKPKKLKKLFGSPTVNSHIISFSRLVELMKSASKSEKEDKKLPGVVFDLLRVALKESAFELFWNEGVENGLLKEKSGPVSYMCYRLLGSALPLLSMEQLQVVLKGKVMLHYGEHVAAQFPQGFKFAAEMEGYIDTFLSSCDDPERQLAVMMGFSTLTSQGKPVMLSTSRVVRHLQTVALQKFINWLKDMFLRPDLDCCLDFSSNRQKQNRENADIFWTYLNVVLFGLHACAGFVMTSLGFHFVTASVYSRFCFFHAFFVAKKKNSQIAEASVLPSEPLNERDHTETENCFFGLLQTLSTLEKHVHGVTADGKLWIFLLVEYASKLLSSEHIKTVKPFTKEQRDIWERTVQSVKNLQKKENKSDSAKVGAFQQLLLSMAIHLFKVGSLKNISLFLSLFVCSCADNSEPGWVEVMVEILLSLLAQPSLLLRRISKSVFVRICPNLTKRGLQLILDVSEALTGSGDELFLSQDEEGSEDSSDEDNTDSGDEENEEVDDNFRSQLMKVLQAGNTLEGDKSDEELDDEAMMALDKNISALFAEQQKRIQAKKDEKDRMRKEKILRRDFKTKVLDLIDVFLDKQAENPLVFDIIEPLLQLIEQCMSSDSDKQEVDFLQKTASIFKNSLCRNKQYCKRVAPLQEDVHSLLQRLVEKACKHTDSAVLLNPGCLNVKKMAVIYQQALTQFLSKRNSPLTCSMFHDLFKRFPVSAAKCVLCCILLAPKYDCNSGESREGNFSLSLIFSLCRKPKKEKTASKPAQGAELLKRKKKGFLPETKKRKNRKKGIQENGVAPGEDGEPAAPEEQPLGTETPKQKKGLVPGEAGLDSLGSWGGCSGTAELMWSSPVEDSEVMQPPKCLGLNGFAHADSGVSYLATLVLSITIMIWFPWLFAAGCRRGHGPCGSAETSINQ
uniref:MYB binding protein 1a n=1 Tax=Malurus cyaneus samueli TaxID=2593467 RepID=A0A8C5X1H0_9PASS